MRGEGFLAENSKRLMSIFPPGQFWVFLTDLREPEDNSLQLAVAEAKTLGSREQTTGPSSSMVPIIITSDSRRFEFVWQNYVAYLVRNESFAQPDKERPPVVGAFLERKSSTFLRFLEETTFATAVMQRPMRHWEINCLNHCIDVVSFDEPIIREISDSEDDILAKPH